MPMLDAGTDTADSPQTLTVVDLGKAVKAKYAGAYDDLDDAELGRRVQAKFPGAYDDYVPVAPAQPAQTAQTYAAPPVAPPPAFVPQGPELGIPHPQTGNGLPSPADVDALTTQHAQTIATALNAPPPPPTAPTFQNPRTGRISVRQPPGQERGPLSMLDMPITGGKEIGAGVQQVQQPGWDAKAGGVSKVLRGAFEAATPFMLPSMAATPLATAGALAAGAVSQQAVEAGLTKLGLPPGWSALAGDLAGLIGGIAGHKISTPAAAALKAKYEPILKARAEKANAPTAPPETATANSTGTEPYQPGSTPPPAPVPSKLGTPPVAPTPQPRPGTNVQAVAKTPQSAKPKPNVKKGPMTITQPPGIGRRTTGLPAERQGHAQMSEGNRVASPDVGSQSGPTLGPEPAPPGWNVVKSEPTPTPAVEKPPATVEKPTPPAPIVAHAEPAKPEAPPAKPAAPGWENHAAPDWWGKAHGSESIAQPWETVRDAYVARARKDPHFKQTMMDYAHDWANAKAEAGVDRAIPAKPEAPVQAAKPAQTAAATAEKPAVVRVKKIAAARKEGATYTEAVAKVDAEAKAPATILDAVNRLEPTRGVPVSTLRLRAEFPNLSKEQFDKQALELRKQQKVFLSQHADPQNLSQADRDMLIHDPAHNDYFVGVSERPAEKPAALTPTEELSALQAKYSGPGPHMLNAESGMEPADATRIDELKTQLGKQPWQRRQQAAREAEGIRPEVHRRIVEKALAEGKPIPAEVLADYPDLAKPTTVAAPAKPVESSHVSSVSNPEVRPQPEQPASQGSPVSEPRRPSHPGTYGAETEVYAEGRDEPYKARYAVRELSDTYPSHNPFTFEPNPDFRYINDRDYSLPANRQRVVTASGSKFRPIKVINTNPDAINGPSIIERDGNVLGGNNRRMALERVYSMNPKGVAAYRALLIRDAALFGLDPAAIERMKQPILVRELDESELDPQHAITEFNYSPAGGHSIGERAAADARGMTPETGKYLAAVMEGAGPEATLTDVLNGKRGPDVVNHLIQAGIFTEGERPELLDAVTDAVTSEAKQRIAKMLLGGLFKNSEEFQAAEPSLRNKLERIVGILKQLESSGADWNLTPDVKQAIEGFSFERDYGKAYGLKPGESFLIKAPESALQGQREYQAGMFGAAPKPPELSPRARALGEFIRTNNQTAIARAFRAFAEKSTEKSLFGEADPDEAFQSAFGSADPRRGSATLNQMTLGLANFVAEDVAPPVRDLVAGARDTVDDLLKILAPTVRDKAAQRGALLLIRKTAELAHKTTVARVSLDQAHRYFEKQTAAENYKFMDRVETGQAQKTPELDAIAKSLRRMLDARKLDVQRLGTGKLQTFYKNYFPHIWKKPTRAASVFAAFFGKRPLQGGKAFLKKRTLPTIADGLAAGLEPISDNPVELVLAKVHEMDRYVMAHETLKEWKKQGLAKFERGLKSPPTGWARIDDSISTVYGRNAAGETIVRGHYYAPEGAARILNNYLSPGMREFALYRGIFGANNFLNQMQLGLSAFHLGFTAADTTVSKTALGYQALAHGEWKQAAKFFLQTPTAAWTTVRLGGRVLKEYERPGTQGPEIAQIVKYLILAGGRARMDAIYQTHLATNMRAAFRKGNVIGAALRAPFAGMEALSNLTMNELVPRMKLGAFADLARFHMKNMPAGSGEFERRRVLAQDWTSIENRLGEMTYDNLFWNKTAKDLAMILVRSVGWNLGTLREVGGGIIDVVAQPANALRGKPVNLNRLSYILGLATVTAAMSAIYQYLKTGKGPSELKDYFFPKNGETDEQGRAQRSSLPTYIKDIYHYGTHPFKTLEGKVAPIWSLLAEMIHNRDFYGVAIRNEDDPLVQQLLELAKHVGTSAVPLGVRNYQRETKLGSSLGTRAEQFVGISPAPTDLNQSPAERMAHEFAAARTPDEPRTALSAERRDLRQSLARALRQGKAIPADVLAARKAGTLTRRDMAEALRESRESSLAVSFTHLGIGQAMRVFREATPQERDSLRGPLLKKWRAAKETMGPEQRAKTLAELREALR